MRAGSRQPLRLGYYYGTRLGDGVVQRTRVEVQLLCRCKQAAKKGLSLYIDGDRYTYLENQTLRKLSAIIILPIVAVIENRAAWYTPRCDTESNQEG